VWDADPPGPVHESLLVHLPDLPAPPAAGPVVTRVVAR
jgi:hypothetical protein